MSGSSGKTEWYIARDGQQHGPLSEVELDKFIELGHLKPTDLLWRIGFSDWRPAAAVFPPRPPEAQTPPPDSQPQSAASADPEPILTQPEQLARQPQAGASQTAAPGPQDKEPAQPLYGEQQQVSPSAVTQRPDQAAQSPIVEPRLEIEPHRKEAETAYSTAPAQNYSTTNQSDRDLDEDAFLEDEPAGRSGWLLVAAALFVAVLLGAAGLFAYNNQPMITAWISEQTAGAQSKSKVVVVRAPKTAAKEAVDKSPVPAESEKPVAAALNQTNTITPPATTSKPLPELPILKSKLWQFAQQEFGEWTETQLKEIRRLAEEDKSKEEANKFLIDAFVVFRRRNATAALSAEPDRLADIARAFVASLEALTAKGPQACYAFISNGESTPEVASLYFEPQVGEKLQAQMLAIMKAVANGKSAGGSLRPTPTADDFDKLSAELGKRGWSPEDLRLFSDPNALSKAEPNVVCRLVTEWFATQTALQEGKTRDQLIAASLRPVIGG